jgi:hypothetical protein
VSRPRAAPDPELQAKYGDTWQHLEEISRDKTALEPKQHFYTPSYSPHLNLAVAIVEATGTDADEEEREAARKLAASIQVGMSPLQQALFIDHLRRAGRWLDGDDPYMRALVGDGDADSAAATIAASRLDDEELVQQLLTGGADAVAASDDPAIVAARAIQPLIRQVQRQAEALAAAEAVQERRIGQALYAVYGDQISPDATMTLRFSDGVVRGYPYNGTIAPPHTTFYGLYGRNAAFDNQDPFHLPEAWLERVSSIDLTKAVNFVSTNDIIGGNSGSPVVDRDLRVVGLIFDGNIEQLPNRFLYRDKVERSVSVHVDAIIESMSKIYGANRVLQELLPAGS